MVRKSRLTEGTPAYLEPYDGSMNPDLHMDY
jgi:hypothetical protein